MTDLREHFAAMADEAKHYNVADSVIRVARRRHRLAQLAPAGVAAAAAAAVLAVWLPLTAEPGGGEQAGGPAAIDAAGPAEPATVDWVPGQWAVSETASPLPAGKPVGPAALAYTHCPAAEENCTRFFLLTRDGAHYAIPESERVDISPDGRWLVHGPEQNRMLRDLTGTATRPLGTASVAAWSPDSGLLVLEPLGTSGVNPASVTVMVLESGQTRQVPVHSPNHWAVRGVFPSGDLLLVPRGNSFRGTDLVGTPPPSLEPPHRPAETPGFFLAIADGHTGGQRGLDVPLTGGVLAKSEEIGVGPAMPLVISPDGRTLYYQVLRSRTDDDAVVAGDLLALSADTGDVLARYELPARGATVDHRELVAARPDGVLLTVSAAGGHTVELMDPDSGERRLISTAPAGSRLLLPGALAWQM